ncbi:MAG: EF-hand domain-containing protein [Proteobacteria bacterium]|nr:EF-hand domain-containing protein [Pseudomonadota bacterium]
MLRLPLTFALSLSILLAAPVLAQSAGSPADDAPAAAASATQQHWHHGPSLKERFAAADLNHDGRLTKEEAASIPFVAKHFDQIDSNHDGYVTLEEIKAWHQEMKAKRAQRAAEHAQGGDAMGSPAQPAGSGE